MLSTPVTTQQPGVSKLPKLVSYHPTIISIKMGHKQKLEIFKQRTGKTLYELIDDPDVDEDALASCYARTLHVGEEIVKVKENDKVTYRLLTFCDLDMVEKIRLKIAKRRYDEQSTDEPEYMDSLEDLYEFGDRPTIISRVCQYSTNDELSFCLFDGWKASIVDNCDIKQIHPILDYIMDVLSNKDTKRYNGILQFMARMLQHPEEQPHVCPLFASLPDTTKDDFWQWFGNSILGTDRTRYCSKYTRDLDFLSSYYQQDWVVKDLYYGCSADDVDALESRIDRPHAYHRVNKIKLCIGKIRNMENFSKWYQLIKHASHTNFVMLSDSPHLVSDKSKMCIIRPNIAYLTQDLKDKLYRAMNNPTSADIFFTFLMNLPTEKYFTMNPSPNPTEYEIYKIFYDNYDWEANIMGCYPHFGDFCKSIGRDDAANHSELMYKMKQKEEDFYTAMRILGYKDKEHPTRSRAIYPNGL